MRNINLEAAIWTLFSSTEFFEAAARECEETMEWIGALAVLRRVPNFGRNNQIFDTFKKLGNNFRKGCDLARLGDYSLIWNTSCNVPSHIRGVMEQPLHSWMSEPEYQEFNNVRIRRLMKYAGRIESALNNAMTGAGAFFYPDPDCLERSNDDDGFPGDTIVRWYNDYVNLFTPPVSLRIANPSPEYSVDTSTACRTGDEVPWTGVWFPSTGLESHSLTFAIQGMRMQPAYRVLKTTEELRTDEYMFPPPETVAVETVWHLIKPAASVIAASDEIWSKEGEPCPKAGLWQATDPGAAPRIYQAGEPMASLGSAFGLTVWRWVAGRQAANTGHGNGSDSYGDKR